MSPLLRNPDYVPVQPARPDLVRPLLTLQREAVESALILCEGDRKLAAARLQVSLSKIHRWIRIFRMEQA